MRCHSAMFGGAGYLLTFLEPVRRGRTRVPFAASILRLRGAACHMMCRCCRKPGNGSGVGLKRGMGNKEMGNGNEEIFSY